MKPITARNFAATFRVGESCSFCDSPFDEYRTLLFVVVVRRVDSGQAVAHGDLGGAATGVYDVDGGHCAGVVLECVQEQVEMVGILHIGKSWVMAGQVKAVRLVLSNRHRKKFGTVGTEEVHDGPLKGEEFV